MGAARWAYRVGGVWGSGPVRGTTGGARDRFSTSPSRRDHTCALRRAVACTGSVARASAGAPPLN